MVGEPEDRDAHWVTASSSPRIATDRRKSIHSQTSRPGIRVDRPGTRFIDISTIARPHAGKEVTGEVFGLCMACSRAGTAHHQDAFGIRRATSGVGKRASTKTSPAQRSTSQLWSGTEVSERLPEVLCRLGVAARSRYGLPIATVAPLPAGQSSDGGAVQGIPGGISTPTSTAARRIATAAILALPNERGSLSRVASLDS